MLSRRTSMVRLGVNNIQGSALIQAVPDILTRKPGLFSVLTYVHVHEPLQARLNLRWHLLIILSLLVPANGMTFRKLCLLHIIIRNRGKEAQN
jgi:hypothetical protein